MYLLTGSSPQKQKRFFVVFWNAFRVPKHHLRSKPSIHVRLRGKIKLAWSRSEYPVSKYHHILEHLLCYNMEIEIMMNQPIAQTREG
jgi:hypothetical protein